MSKILSHIKDVSLKATSGKETIPGNKLFSWIDSDFKNYGADEKGKATKKATVSVYEMQQDATFEQMFSSLGNPDDLCLTQEQIIAFCKDHKDDLRQDGWGTFFLIKSNNTLFVVGVFVDGGELVAYVSRFADDNVWLARSRHRLVVPQLSPSDSQTLAVQLSSDPLTLVAEIEERTEKLRQILESQ